MTENDLRTLWQSQHPLKEEEVKKMRERLVAKAKSFERKIRWRNLREYLAALLVLPFFLAGQSHARGALDRAGMLVLAGACVWTVVYLWLKHRREQRPQEELSIQEYRERLIGGYDRQIQLLKQAKYWYVLPFYAGFLPLSAGGIVREWEKRQSLSWFNLLMPLVFTVACGAIWYLNEVYGVRKLREERRRVEELE